MQLDLLNRPSGRTAMLMASGFTFDLENPDATGMPITDIARALAYALDGLMHDADELSTPR